MTNRAAVLEVITEAGDRIVVEVPAGTEVVMAQVLSEVSWCAAAKVLSPWRPSKKGDDAPDVRPPLR